MNAVVIGAPVAGWATPLEEVPDEVFAGRLMGDGIAIDPLDGVVRAPCAATVDAVAAAGHSVTLRLANGAELLIHIGVDTVALGGAGLALKVKAGDRVDTGAALIEVDLDRVACAAKSLLTPIVVANEGYEVEVLARDALVAAGDPVLSVRPVTAAVADADDTGADTARCEVVVPLAHGLHARPAARIAAALKPHAAAVSVEFGERSADARSTVGLMKLAIRHGDRIAVTGRGADARAAVMAVASLIEGGMGEAGPAAGPTHSGPVPVSTGPLIRGVRASPGLAVGPAFRFAAPEIAVEREGAGVAHETALLGSALAAVSAELERTGGTIAEAHRAMLDDPELADGARGLIAKGRSAGWSWREAVRGQADALAATGDARMAERAADLRDLEGRVIARIAGADLSHPEPPPGSILIADELLPSQFLALAPGVVAGVATAGGGPTSHVAILAAAAGVPMLVACGPGLLRAADGATAVLDADAGAIDLAPDPERLRTAARQVGDAGERRSAEARAAHDLCVTADGTRIEVFANLGSVADARAAVLAGAEGCGLLRTEFLFLDRAAAPDEEEQAAAYAAVADALQGRPLIVRTLDVGGDKPVPYLPFPREENPALGARGVRLGLARPDLLATQLRAILRGVPADRCRIMLPMIVDRGEFLTVRAILDQAARATGLPAPPLGVMVETPAAALLARDLAEEAAFLSLGSNDLTQYALAADRGNPALAGRIDALHPAVLRLVASAGEGAAAHGRQLGVCGGLASDPLAAALLIGLGVTELSATPAAVPAVKAAVRALRLDHCRALAVRALAMGTAADVRALVEAR